MARIGIGPCLSTTVASQTGSRSHSDEFHCFVFLLTAAWGAASRQAQLHHHDTLHQQPGQLEADDEHVAGKEQEHTVRSVPRLQGRHNTERFEKCAVGDKLPNLELLTNTLYIRPVQSLRFCCCIFCHHHSLDVTVVAFCVGVCSQSQQAEANSGDLAAQQGQAGRLLDTIPHRPLRG